MQGVRSGRTWATRTGAIARFPPAFYPLTGKTWTAFMINCTSSPSLRSRSSTDSVVRTEAIYAGAETSNLTSDITSSDFIEVTLASIWFLAPYCCIRFAAPFSLGLPRRTHRTQEGESSILRANPEAPSSRHLGE